MVFSPSEQQQAKPFFKPGTLAHGQARGQVVHKPFDQENEKYTFHSTDTLLEVGPQENKASGRSPSKKTTREDLNSGGPKIIYVSLATRNAIIGGLTVSHTATRGTCISSSSTVLKRFLVSCLRSHRAVRKP